MGAAGGGEAGVEGVLRGAIEIRMPVSLLNSTEFLGVTDFLTRNTST